MLDEGFASNQTAALSVPDVTVRLLKVLPVTTALRVFVSRPTAWDQRPFSPVKVLFFTWTPGVPAPLLSLTP